MIASIDIKPWHQEIINAYLVDSFTASKTGDSKSSFVTFPKFK